MKMNGLNIFMFLLTLVFAALTIFFRFNYIGAGQEVLTYLISFIILATIFIFLRKDTVHFKFMYPGLLTFLLFMIIPIFFSLYISFTNLSTGHFLSESQVRELLLEERFLAENAEIFDFRLYKDKSKHVIKTKFKNKVFVAHFDINSKVPIILKTLTNNSLKNLSQLKTSEVFLLKDRLKSLIFITPNKKELSYYRVSQLGEVSKRYESFEVDGIKDLTTNEIFFPNSNTGFFTSNKDKKRIAPGFYIIVGLENFISIFKNETIKSSFLKVCLWTLIWGLMSVFLSFSAGMFLAIFLNDKNLKLKPIYRSLLIIPYSIPFFISVLIFKGMLNKDFGIINEFLANIGIVKVPWLDDPIMAKISVLLVNLWLGFPYMFLLITGILQSIPSSVYEAAKLDGANSWTTFKKITLPLIMTSIAPLLIGSFAFNLNNFVGIYLLTGGGPPIAGAITPVGETDILISYTYRLAFEGAGGQDFGLASSISLFIFVIISILTLINFKLTNMTKEELS